MFPLRYLTLPLLVIAVAGPSAVALAGADMPTDAAWTAMQKYEPGQDMAALLTIDRDVIAAMKSPEARSACAAKLADLLGQEDTTPAAKQYICLQLRQVGTADQVPLLGRMLEQPETSEMARYALESIPGPEASGVLREALAKLDGEMLVGLINSLGARKETACVPALQGLADSSDPATAEAAIGALGSIANGPAASWLLGRAERAGIPTPGSLTVALLRCAYAGERADAIYALLSQPEQPVVSRRAALEGLLYLEGDRAEATVLTWFSSDDAERRRIAAGHLQNLSDEQLDKLVADLANLPDAGRLAVIELSASRRGAEMLPKVMTLVGSADPRLKVAGVQLLGMIGDASAISALVDLLEANDEVTAAAQQSLTRLPRQQVTAALLETLSSRPQLRQPAIAVLVDLKCYDAIDPLIEIAAGPDPADYAPALEGLRGIADPDKTDIPRLVKLLLRSQPGKHRDEVEKTIVIVCDKLPAGEDRSELVLASLADVARSESPKYLPLLGRLGGSKARSIIEAALADSEPAVQEASVRALCNWPNAEVADRLLAVATGSENRAYRRWALRAYIRVVTLASDRPESETLAMLQNAFKLADGVDEKRLAIERSATVRTLDALKWIAPMLDDPQLAQAACLTVVELAHHRFLRHPNMGEFAPVLDKVSATAEDPDVVERAKRYRLGL